MDDSAKTELNNIIRELNSIIIELDSISNGVKTDFQNIGNDRCATGVSKVAQQYRWVKTKLQNIK